MKLHRHVSWVWRELMQRRASFALAVVCMALAAGLFVLLPAQAARLIGELSAGGDIGGLSLNLLGLLGLFFVASLFGYTRIYLMTRLSFQITAGLRSRIYRRILEASPRRLSQISGGQLMSGFSNDLVVFQEALVRAIAVFAPSLFMFAVFAAAMVWYSWILFLCTVVLISPLVLVTSYFGRRLHGAAHTTQDALAELTGRFEEMLNGLKDVKAFNRERAFTQQFEAANDRTLRRQLDREGFDAFHPAAVSMTVGLGIAGMILISAILLDRGYVDVPSLTAFLVCLGMAYAPLQEVSHVAGRLTQLSALLDRFERILELPPENGGRQALASPVRGDLEFEKVEFSYGDGPFSLDGFDLRIEAGQRVALVGPSGGGKSTLVEMIPRFLTPDGGRILFDGVDAATLSLDELRRNIGIVFQQPMLFEGTVRDNIRFGAPDAGDDEVLRAAIGAHVDDFVRLLPAGYDAPVERGGRNFSVGQRQRIAIARVLLRNPRVLLLDEPTSALDAESEALVRDALEVASAGRTTLIVAHRLSTVRAADRIVVIERGRIIEDGTHQQLYRQGGLYRKLCDEQFRQESAPAEND
jgi:subfamily B ATP-binding cassette protein MsbA